MDNKNCDNEYFIIKGVIVEGIGEGSKYVMLYSENILLILGIKPFPGTLNILVDKEYLNIIRDMLNIERATYVIPPPAEGLGKVYAWKAYIDCLSVYIIKPEITIHSSNVIEIISSMFLRKILNKKSGDSIAIVITSRGLIPCFCQELQ